MAAQVDTREDSQGLGTSVKDGRSSPLSSSSDSTGQREANWAPDKERNSCSDCCDAFSPFIRKHHCRSCGEIFCASCCKLFLLLPKYKLSGYVKPQRTCRSCTDQHGASAFANLGKVEHRLPVWELAMSVTRKKPLTINGELMQAGEYVLRVCTSSKVLVSFQAQQAVESTDEYAGRAEWEKRVARSQSSFQMEKQTNGRDLCSELYFTLATSATWLLSVTFPAALTSADVTVTILHSCTCDKSAHFGGAASQGSSNPRDEGENGVKRRALEAGARLYDDGMEKEGRRRPFRAEPFEEKAEAAAGTEEEKARELDSLDEDNWGFHNVDREALVREYGCEAVRKELAVGRIPTAAVNHPSFRAACERWPSYEGHTALTYPHDEARQELGRWSIYKEQARELGLIRPFLLFVSMHPEVRLSYAQILEVPLWTLKDFGDAHFEAWCLLASDSNSIQHRSNCAFSGDGDWYQLLWRLCNQALNRAGETSVETCNEITALALPSKQSLGYCREPENIYMRALEEVFMRGLVEVFDGYRSDEGTEEADDTQKLVDSECISGLVDKLRAAGFADEALMKRLAAATVQGRSNHIVSGLDGWCSHSQLVQEVKQVARFVVPGAVLLIHLLIAASPLFTLSPLVIIPFTSLSFSIARFALCTRTPFSVLLPIIGITCQRELLAYHDIGIDEYYGGM